MALATREEFDKFCKSKAYKSWVNKYFSNAFDLSPNINENDVVKMRESFNEGIYLSLNRFFQCVMHFQEMRVVSNVLFSVKEEYNVGDVELLKDLHEEILKDPKAPEWKKEYMRRQIDKMIERTYKALK